MLFASIAFAEDYPTRTIRLVVGFAAGGPTDIPARYVADKLGALLGQRVIVENKPAAAGMLATRDVRAQPRDGYNLLLCTHFESINRAVYRNAQFELSDLAPISLISKYYYGLALSNAVPATDLKGFIAYRQGASRRDQLRHHRVLAPGVQEIFARQLERLAGIHTMNRVPYRGGAQAMQDLLPGRLQFFVSPMLSIIPLANDGKLRSLGVSSTEQGLLRPHPTCRHCASRASISVRFGWLGICAAALAAAATDYRPVAQATRCDDRRLARLPRRDRSAPARSPPPRAPRSCARSSCRPALMSKLTIQEFGLQQEQ